MKTHHFIYTRVVDPWGDPDAFPNMREASEYLETLSPERRAELEADWHG